MKKSPGLFAWTTVFLGVLLWSAIAPKEYFTWFLEVFPALIAFAALALAYRRFRFTPLACALILIHACILFVGGHYTYAEVPLFDWVRDALHQSRNNYDKLGHLAQGFVPAIVIRELLIRHGVVIRRGWLFPLVTLACLGISAAYELFEWLMAEISGSGADAFLGTQGYAWDTQSDMLMALIGAVTAQLLLARYHDRMIPKAD
jgi:putative membrane protein